jgi:flagellar basal body rod protein FlgB
MSKKKNTENLNYELEFLKTENEKLKYELKKLDSKNNLDLNKDIQNLVQISMKMKYLLDRCRSEIMMPFELGKEIDKVIKEIENYN